MKRIKLFEEHTKDYHVANLFKIIIANFKKDNNILNQQPELTLIEEEPSYVNDAIEKNIIFNFQDPMYMTQVVLVIKPHNSPDFKNKEYKGYIMIKLYDIETNELVVGNEYQITLSDTDEGIKIKEETETQAAQGQMPAQGQGQPIQGQVPPQGQEMPAESLKYKGYPRLYEQEETKEKLEGDYDGSLERFIIDKIAELKDKI